MSLHSRVLRAGAPPSSVGQVSVDTTVLVRVSHALTTVSLIAAVATVARNWQIRYFDEMIARVRSPLTVSSRSLACRLRKHVFRRRIMTGLSCQHPTPHWR